MNFRPLKKKRNVGEVRESMGDDGYLRGSYRGWPYTGFEKNGAKPNINQPNKMKEWMR